jgi:antitoxin component of RelBE/YafQ-DinJ toxin-antitoxin module
MTKKRITVRLKENTYLKLVKYAAERGLTINGAVNLILTNILNFLEEKE